MAALTPTEIVRPALAQADYSHEPGAVEKLLTDIAGGDTGAGNSMALIQQKTHLYSWQTIIGNSPGDFTALTVRLEGSLNGTDWAVLDETTEVVGELRHIVFHAVKYVRANIITSTVSSGSPTVTVLFGE